MITDFDRFIAGLTFTELALLHHDLKKHLGSKEHIDKIMVEMKRRANAR